MARPAKKTTAKKTTAKKTTAKKTTAKKATAKKTTAEKTTAKKTTAKKTTAAGTVKVAAAKGRPMLSWVGKRPLTSVAAFPAQHVETFDPTGELDKPNGDDVWSDWPSAYPRGGLLFHGDNKEVLGHLLANGFRKKIDLIYIDPPFDSGADYVRQVSLRGAKGTAKIAGEELTLGEQVQYTDIWANDEYLQFMYERLILLRELLSDGSGSIFVHCDNRKMHLLRVLLDEVFGAESFVNEIVWMHQIMGGSHDKRFPKAHETLLWYAKGSGYRLHSDDPNVRVPFSEYVRNSMKQDEQGRWYYERRRMSRKATAQEALSKAHTRTYVDDPEAGTVVADVWNDMLSYQEPPDEREGLDLYPTQKPTELLMRVVSAASEPGALVLDAFAGSGVVAKVAQRLGRRWIACDINKGAIQVATSRLQATIRAQSAAGERPSLLEEDASPLQNAFTVWRVNDYDLQLQHNEAVELASQHVGVQRTRTDAFFDGTLGKNLVKIVPFMHPLSPLDLESIKSELEARPDEDRSVTAISLGIELAARKWIDDWNRLRRGRNAVNRIEYIELRSDAKHGGWIKHEPASAKVDVKRDEGRIVVHIKDFVSPAIVERLRRQTGVTKPKIDDWRAMVDSVMIDTDYDGKVFNINLSDVPERKQDFVAGRYELPASYKATVAVKITDMLGEEVLITDV